jgi:hypothetical protein
MKLNHKNILSLFYMMVLLAIITPETHAQWKVSLRYEDPFSPGRGYYNYTPPVTAGVGTSTNLIYNWLTQYASPLVPPTGTHTLPTNLDTTSVSVPWGGTGAWDEWKSVLVSELARTKSRTYNEQLEVFANVRLTINWDTANFGPAPSLAYFEGRSFVSQYKNDLPQWISGTTTQYINFVGFPDTPQQIIYATMGQKATDDLWTMLANSAVIYGGNNTLWHSDYVDFVDNNWISHYTYINRTKQFPGDEAIHGGRVHIPIVNGSSVIRMGIHQTLFATLFGRTGSGSNVETQSKASAEFRIIPNTMGQ